VIGSPPAGTGKATTGGRPRFLQEPALSADLSSRVSGHYIFLGGTYWTDEHTRRILLPLVTYLPVQLRAIS
jgi:hypothetical protein